MTEQKICAQTGEACQNCGCQQENTEDFLNLAPPSIPVQPRAGMSLSHPYALPVYTEEDEKMFDELGF